MQVVYRFLRIDAPSAHPSGTPKEHNVRSMKTVLATTLVAGMAVTGLTVPAQAESSEPSGSSDSSGSSSKQNGPVVVNQGDAVGRRNGECQVGYVDKKSHTVYLARHCFGEAPGELVYTKGNIPVGKTTRSAVPPEDGAFNYLNDDVMAVQLFSDIVAGDNRYSGDALASYPSLMKGMRACMNSRQMGKVVCGVIEGAADGVTSVVADEAPISGDSGGPGWLVDKNGEPAGLLGVLSIGGTQSSTEQAGRRKITKLTWEFDSLTHKPCRTNTESPKFMPKNPSSCGLREDAPGTFTPLTEKRPLIKNEPGWTSSQFEQISSKRKQGIDINDEERQAIIETLVIAVAVLLGLAGFLITSR